MVHILSETDGKTVSAEIIQNQLIANNVTFICVCGPSAFNDISRQLIKDKGFDLKNLHVFQG